MKLIAFNCGTEKGEEKLFIITNNKKANFSHYQVLGLWLGFGLGLATPAKAQPLAKTVGLCVGMPKITQQLHNYAVMNAFEMFTSAEYLC